VLKLAGVSASYGTVPAVQNVSIEIGEGEAVGLLGANGAGKSTTLRVISGLVGLTAGKITFAGTDLASLPPHRIPELGIAHVPEGRQVFPEMTVQENLEIGAYVPKAKAERSRTLELVYSIFPRLADRKKQIYDQDLLSLLPSTLKSHPAASNSVEELFASVELATQSF